MSTIDPGGPDATFSVEVTVRETGPVVGAGAACGSGFGASAAGAVVVVAGALVDVVVTCTGAAVVGDAAAGRVLDTAVGRAAPAASFSGHLAPAWVSGGLVHDPVCRA